MRTASRCCALAVVVVTSSSCALLFSQERPDAGPEEPLPEQPAEDEDAGPAPPADCALSDSWRGAVDGALDDVTASWVVTNGGEAVDEQGGSVVRFDASALCLDGGGLEQTLSVPAPCGGLTPSHYAAVSGSAMVGGVEPWVLMRIGGVTLPMGSPDMPRCLGDAVFGRVISFGVTARRASLGESFEGCAFEPVQVDVREADLVAAACPAPGEVASDFARWLTFVDNDGAASVGPAGELVLTTEGACDYASAYGPHGGALSIPTSFAGPALVVTGDATILPGGALGVVLDDMPLASLPELHGQERLCLPPIRRGHTATLHLTLRGASGACSAPQVQEARVTSLALVDDPSCGAVGLLDEALEDQRYWSLTAGASVEDGALSLTSSAQACGSSAGALFATPPATSGLNALLVRYSHDDDGTVLEAKIDLTPARATLAPTGAASGEARLCLDPLTATELLPLVFSLSHPNGCDDGAAGIARVESVELVSDVDCPPLQ